MIRQIKIRENGALVGIMAMSAATVRRYMSQGFRLFLDKEGHAVLSR